MRQDSLCGLSFWHPKWLQRFANTKTFMIVYGMLGTVQAMSYMYFIVTLTTIEKRFKIPSQTTGIVLSGNEISQILLSLILSYAGGQRNRPRWIAWGMVCCAASCFILALPHFIYGAGKESLQLTKEYGESFNNSISLVVGQHLCFESQFEKECDQLVTIFPLVLIFLSQFVLGIGNTLYYSLGQTYIDDNTKKTNTPLMLSFAMALRLIGPVFGFQLGYASLNLYIDPTKTPLIDKNDARWLGAWWFGWMILGSTMLLFSGLIGLFPKKLPKQINSKFHSGIPKALQADYFNETSPLQQIDFTDSTKMPTTSTIEFPKMKDFSKALMRLLRNKLLLFNITSAIFYILGAAGYMTFLAKYMEVQFHKAAQNATVLIGPLTIIGMVFGLLTSGIILSKRKPRAGKVLFWNVIVGFVFLAGEASYLFLYCGDTESMIKDGILNISFTCNANCSCEGAPYTPICHGPSQTTYFSPCHAGCNVWNSKEKVYSNCSCLPNSYQEASSIEPIDLHQHENFFEDDLSKTGLSSTLNENTNAFDELLNKSMLSTAKLDEFTNVVYQTEENIKTSSTSNKSAEGHISITDSRISPAEMATSKPIASPMSKDTSFSSSTEEALQTEFSNSRKVRYAGDEFTENTITPGACLEGCVWYFYAFTLVSMAINLFGSSGRVGNILVNYRAVATEDKAFAQGLALMLVSLFALIPGPIIFGWIIDQTCLVWAQQCNQRGHCQLYDQTKFRFHVNYGALGFTGVGVLFDILVWWYGRNLDLYGEQEQIRLKEIQRKKRVVKPLLKEK